MQNRGWFSFVKYVAEANKVKLLSWCGDFIGGEVGVLRNGLYGHAVGFHLTHGLAQLCRRVRRGEIKGNYHW